MELVKARELADEMMEEKEARATDDDKVNVGGLRVRPRLLKHECVTGVHARVTSDDDAAFELHQEQERKEQEAILGVVYAAAADKRGRCMIESCVNGGNNDGDRGDEQMRYNRDWYDTPLGLSSDLYDAPPQGLRITDGQSATKL